MKKLILGMSMKRRDLASWIDNHTYQTMIALAQLYLFPTGNRKHWRKEVWEKFSRIYTLKSNKLPKAQFILDNSWNIHKDDVWNALDHAEAKEEVYPVRKDANHDSFYQITEDYFIWLADKFSKNPSLRLSDVYEELDRLGLDEEVLWR